MCVKVKDCLFCYGSVNKFDAIIVNEKSNVELYDEIGKKGWCHRECFDTRKDNL